MTPPFLLALAVAAAAPACPTTTEADAFLCHAVAASDRQQFPEAAQAFDQAAAASPAGAAKTQRLWAAAGNMWIAAGQPGKAAVALDKALAGSGLPADQRGLALLDRARAAEAQSDLKTARRFATEAEAAIADDPFLWYFEAALGIREGDLPRAKSAINRALSLASDSPEILFEAGHVAQASGDTAGARDYWTRAIAADPGGPTAVTAKRALAMLDAPISVSPANGGTTETKDKK